MSLEKQLADYGRLHEELFGAIEVDEITNPLPQVRPELTASNQTLLQRSISRRNRYAGPAWAVAAFVAVLAVGGLYFALSRDGGPVASTPTTTPLEADVAELLNGFVNARIVGEGAQQYLNGGEEDIPLLYATTSGVPYERGEIEPVLGIDWPYGWKAFKVRLFANDTLVEQLFFFPTESRLGLEYVPDGFGTDIAPLTEDGEPVAVPYSYFDGEVILQAAHPWIFHDPDSYDIPFGRLIPEGQMAPTTDGAQRGDWDEFFLIADPTPAGSFARDCQPDTGPADVEALAQSINSYPGLEASSPVAVRVGGVDALMMDVEIAAGANITIAVNDGGGLCLNSLLYPVFDKNADYSGGPPSATGQAKGDRMRLYLVDMPEGSSMRTMAIVIAPESRSERAVKAAAPVVDSVEFHAP
jgi:hypothetical protein